MTWVVDTCVLIDIRFATPAYGRAGVKSLSRHGKQGLVVCPMTTIELGPAFAGNRASQAEFLHGVGCSSMELWREEDTNAATEAWTRYAQLYGAKRILKRPLADVLIGAFSLRFSGLITRNPGDFRDVFPSLTLVDPSR